MTNDTRVTTVVVNIQPEGAYFVAHSVDVPGLHVWGESQEQVCERVMKAIKLLFKLNRHIDVEVYPSADPDTFPEIPNAKDCNSFVVATA